VTDTSSEADLIWHYTDATGLLGIMNPDQPHIYATDALYLNDTRELLTAMERQIAIMLKTLPGGDDLVGEHTVKRLYGGVLRSAIQGGISAPEGIYIASFCKHGDLLSQWRGYGTAAGYAIGFARSDLNAQAASNGDKLVDVNYGEPDETFIERLVPRALRVSERTTFDSDPIALASLKDSAFAEEDEVRLIAQDGGRPVQFRSSARGIIPYLKIDLALTCVKEVRLGPGLNDDTAARAVQRLARQRGLERLEVSRSEVPYRS
jgi:hypothetical protein